MTTIRIYEVTAIFNASGCDGHGERRVLWTGQNTRRAAAQKALERLQARPLVCLTYSDFRLESRDEECDVV